MNEAEKIREANAILQKLKKEVLHIIGETEIHEYCSNRLVLPWLEEDAEYAIKKLHLPTDKEKYYLRKLYRIFGEYSEEIPFLRRKPRSKNITDKD